MLSFLDMAERMQKGPKMDENAWNLGLFRKMNELTERYQLKYPADGSYFNMDDALADRAFQAGVAFLAEMGAYCISTGRVIQFSESELWETIREIPSQITVGAGKDARVIKRRSIEEKEGLNQCPGHHAPWTEDMARLVVKNFAQVHSGDYLEGFNFPQVDGREIHGMPMEVYAARRETAWLREGVRKAGRPGMAIAFYPINTRAPVMLAPIDPELGLRPTDGILLSTLPDVKVEQDYLAAAMVYEEYGCFKVNGGGGGSVGGFAGGTGGAIIESIAKSLVGFIVYRDKICNTGVGRVTSTTAKTISINPEMIWAGSVVHQALHRNSNTIRFGGNIGQSGPGTETHLLEQAIGAITAAINGSNLYIPRQHRAQMNASQTPLEAEWMYEVSSSIIKAGLDRASAGELIRRASGLLNGRPVEEPLPIDQTYDLVHHRPLPSYEKVYLEVKDKLASLGMPFA